MDLKTGFAILKNKNHSSYLNFENTVILINCELIFSIESHWNSKCHNFTWYFTIFYVLFTKLLFYFLYHVILFSIWLSFNKLWNEKMDIDFIQTGELRLLSLSTLNTIWWRAGVPINEATLSPIILFFFDCEIQDSKQDTRLVLDCFCLCLCVNSGWWLEAMLLQHKNLYFNMVNT